MNLLPHQDVGVAFLASRDVACLWDEAGTGKTAQVVRAAHASGRRRILVFCPAAVRTAWAIEVEKWSVGGTPPIAVVASGEDAFLPEGSSGWQVMSHAALISDALCGRLWRGGDWDLIVFDEHSEYRRYQARRTRNALGDGGIHCMGKAVWMLDGDPVVNSSMDLYPLFYGPLRRHLGAPPDAWDFGRHYATWLPDGRNSFRAAGVRNEDDLALRLRPFVMRRTLASAGIELPMLDVVRVPVPIPPEAAAEAARVLAAWETPEARQRLERMVEERDEVRESDLSRARHVLGVAKAPEVARHIYGLVSGGGGPVVVFFQHRAVRDWLRDSLTSNRLTVSWIDGTTGRAEVVAAQALYAKGKIDALLVQTQAGGRGLTLTRGNRVVVAEMPWTAVALHQAIKRVHRITQTRDVRADVMLAQGQWLDAAMAATARRKDEAAQRLMSLVTT